MEKLSGLKLDVFDDSEGEIIKQLFSTAHDLPDIVKSAQVLTHEARSALPDDLFALVLQDGDVTLRKYACIDAGNTALSVEYFLQQRHLLPEEAVKVAAANLETACHWYDIEPPEALKKLSSDAAPSVGRQRIWKDMDGSLSYHDDQSWGTKTAEVVGTADMPTQVVKPKRPGDARRQHEGQLAVTPKTAAERFEAALAGETLERGEDLPTEDQPKAHPQARVMKPHVDVSGKEPPKLIEEKSASYFCMPSIGRYPIDSFSQVKTANVYFQDHHKNMSPEDRREFAENLYKRAEELTYPVAQVVEAYGAPGFAKKAHVVNCIDVRIELLRPYCEQGDTEQVKEACVDFSERYEALKGLHGQLDSQIFALTLQELDKRAGIDALWDGDVPDPFYSTFAKTAEDAQPKDAIVLGNEYMKVRDLQTYARRGGEQLELAFGEDFIKEFQKDPTGIFDSMPMDQKKIIMRLVNNSHSLVEGASAS